MDLMARRKSRDELKRPPEPGAQDDLSGVPEAAKPPDPEVEARPMRRRFTAKYKLRILREVDRVLRSSGHLVILGFKPAGLWGLRRLIPGAGMPPGADFLISDRRLRDWLQLLDMRIQTVSRYFFHWPLPGNKASASNKWERRGQAWWPEFAACYMLVAQKRVSTLTRVRPLWRTQPKVVAGLAEPSTRVSRIRFEEN